MAAQRLKLSFFCFDTDWSFTQVYCEKLKLYSRFGVDIYDLLMNKKQNFENGKGNLSIRSVNLQCNKTLQFEAFEYGKGNLINEFAMQ